MQTLKTLSLVLYVTLAVSVAMFAAESEPSSQTQAPAAASPTPAPEKKPEISVKAYLGYQDGFSATTPRVFDLYRGYIGLSYRISPKVFFSATLDTAARRDEQGFFEVVLKHMFLDYTFRQNHQLQFGQSNVSWVPYMEDLVGDRFIQRSFTESEGYEKSTDMGFVVKGSLLNNALRYHASFINGNGWNRVESNRGKDIQARLTLFPLLGAKDWRKGVFTSIGGTQKFFDARELRGGESVYGYRLHALAGYQAKSVAAGFEVLATRDPASKLVGAHPSAQGLSDTFGLGYSVFTNFRPRAFIADAPEKFGVLIRADWHDPTRGLVQDDAHTRITVGPYWVFNPNLQLWGGYVGVHYQGFAREKLSNQNFLAVFAEVKF